MVKTTERTATFQNGRRYGKTLIRYFISGSLKSQDAANAIHNAFCRQTYQEIFGVETSDPAGVPTLMPSCKVLWLSYNYCYGFKNIIDFYKRLEVVKVYSSERVHVAEMGNQDDLVEGIYRLLQSEEKEPINIGNPDETTILEFAEEIIGLLDTKSEIVHRPLPVDDPKVRQPDISLAYEKLGWRPSVTRQEGIAKTVRYFKDKTVSELEETKQ